MSRRAPLRLPDEPNLEVLPAKVWGVLIGLGLAATASLFGLLGIITGWEIVPGMPYLYNGLLCLALILFFLMVPVAWRQLPDDFRRRLGQVGRSRHAPPQLDPPPWMVPASQVCKALHVSSQQGLPSAVVKQRLKRHGKNDLELVTIPAFPAFFVNKLYTPTRILILMLIVLYTSLVGPEEALVSSAALLLLIFLDLWGEWKAHKAFAAVREGVPHQALVLRDNVASSVDRSLLVPGDIVLLRAGMEVPADLRLIQTTLLEIDESRLSGEWDAVASGKDAHSLGVAGTQQGTPGVGLASCLDLPSIALAGSMVVSGRGSGVVFRTGAQTELGKKNAALAAARMAAGDGAARRASERGRLASLGGSFDAHLRGQGSALGPVSDYELALAGSAWRFMVACLVVCLLSALCGWLRSEAWEDIVLSVLTLFFATLPEHLPVVLLAAMGLGSKPMSRRGVYALGMRPMENLGCVDTVVVDKLGTLTEPKLALSSAVVAATPIGPDDLMEATREVPKSGPLAVEGGLEALGQLLEAWLYMSDMGDDLVQEAPGPAGKAGGAPGGAGAAAGEGKGAGRGGDDGDEEHLKRMESEEKEARAGQVTVDAEWPAGEGEGLQSESLLSASGASGAAAAAENEMTARGGVVDAVDHAMLSAVGGVAVFTQLPYEGMEGEAAGTRGLRPLHDMLKRLYESKLSASLVTETLFDARVRSTSRVFNRVAAAALPTSAPSRAKAAKEKLLALGKRVAGQNGDSAGEKEAKGAPEATATKARMFVRGAPELLIAECAKILKGGEEVPIAPFRAQLQEHVQALAQEGLVVIGYAAGDIPASEAGEAAPVGSVSSCTFLGAFAMMNPVLPGAKATVAECRQAGVRVLVVTADHPSTALYAAKAAGVCHPHQVQDVEAQQDTVSCIDRPPAQSTGEELGELLAGCSVFSRATPTDRLCIVEQLHAPTVGHSNCVAVCGTGSMDAPVLAAADVGVSLGREAADVCRDSAGLVLQDRALPPLALALREGRRAMENARKAVAISLGAKSAMLLVFLVGTAWSRFPFSPMQLAVLAVFLNAGAMFAFVHEPIDSDVFERPPRRPGQPFFDLPLLFTSACAACSIATSVLLAFALALHVLGAQAQSASMAFTTCLLCTALVAFNLRSSREPVFHKGAFSNPWVLLWVGAAVGWCAAISQPWALHRALRLESMHISLWLVLIGISAAGAFWLEALKGVLWFYKKRGYQIPEWDEDAAVAAVTGDTPMVPASEIGEAPLLPAGAQPSHAEHT